MSVRQCLLAILDEGPCYGYQLRSEYNRRTGARWPLNVGQVYTTLERLERDGLVAKGGTDEQGHVFYETTADGHEEARSWLQKPHSSVPERYDLAVKLAVAMTLPRADVSAALNRQHASSVAALAGLTADTTRAEEASDATELVDILLRDALVFRTQAEVQWLEHVAQVLDRAGESRRPVGLDNVPPKRGRPPKVAPPVGESTDFTA